MRNLGNIEHIVLGTVRYLKHIVLMLVSIWFFIFRYVTSLFDLIFTLIRDLTVSLGELEFVLSLLKRVL